ncbi:hypothetical protein M378DRAFT_167476 [Amanita muscaria Koide BX008]|uniref:Uncharacterized protein n=1 Tax=Amanita muscaria (strain Koide BX008) TaxID=946122 RepID=A0A0C2T399_AMAMK|nr:hypothetical protein M378DRAFT_167476 [Amanita muscaria Koide BX008]
MVDVWYIITRSFLGAARTFASISALIRGSTQIMIQSPDNGKHHKYNISGLGDLLYLRDFPSPIYFPRIGPS